VAVTVYLVQIQTMSVLFVLLDIMLVQVFVGIVLLLVVGYVRLSVLLFTVVLVLRVTLDPVQQCAQIAL
jgi:hypothetical protein